MLRTSHKKRQIFKQQFNHAFLALIKVMTQFVIQKKANFIIHKQVDYWICSLTKICLAFA